MLTVVLYQEKRKYVFLRMFACHCTLIPKRFTIIDMQGLVKDDEDKKAEQDPAFKEFLNRLNN